MSYGVNAPFGLQPRSYLDGSTYTGAQSEYLINGNVNGGLTSYATSIYSGDLVFLAVDGTIQQATTSSATIGVFLGCEWYDLTNTLQRAPYWAASTATFNNSNPTAFVCDDPNVLFSIQALGTGTVTGNVNTINIGLNANAGYQSDLNYNYDWAVGTGSTISGQSGGSLNMATQTAGGTNPTGTNQQLKLIRLEPRVGNTFGLAYNNGLVLINNHIYKGGTGTAGI